MHNLMISLLLQPVQCLPLPPANAYSGKTVIITGANTGIGYETARHILLRDAAKVIIAVRNLEKGDQAKHSLLTTAGLPQNAASRIEVWHLDMASFASVKDFITRATAIQKIDCVFLNAGLATRHYLRTEDDWESTLQVNALSTALMALLFLPKLIAQTTAEQQTPGSQARAYDPPHICITASGLHSVAPFPEGKGEIILEKLNSEANFLETQKSIDGAQYSMSKLLNVYTAQRIVQIIPTDALGRPVVIVNALCPGFCYSELNREGLPLPMKMLKMVVGRTAEKGSRNLLAAAGMGPESQGKWIMDCNITEYGGMGLSEEGREAGDKVWAEMVDVLRRVAPEVSLIINGQF